MGWRSNPSPRFMAVIKVVSFPYVNSFVPERKQPIRPMKIPRMIGRVNKSPEECFSLIFHFAISTPSSPPNNPPMIVLTFISCRTFTFEKFAVGFSSTPTSLEPTSAPSAAPKMIARRLDDVITSAVLFLK